MPLSLALPTKLAADWPPEKWRDVTVLVAVSGGADSVALARGLNQLRVTGEGRLVLAHFNHKLRGAESDGDQAFVEELAGELGVQVVVGARSAEQIQEDFNSLGTKIPSDFWAELKQQGLIEPNASISANPEP